MNRKQSSIKTCTKMSSFDLAFKIAAKCMQIANTLCNDDIMKRKYQVRERNWTMKGKFEYLLGLYTGHGHRSHKWAPILSYKRTLHKYTKIASEKFSMNKHAAHYWPACVLIKCVVSLFNHNIVCRMVINLFDFSIL